MVTTVPVPEGEQAEARRARREAESALVYLRMAALSLERAGMDLLRADVGDLIDRVAVEAERRS